MLGSALFAPSRGGLDVAGGHPAGGSVDLRPAARRGVLRHGLRALLPPRGHRRSVQERRGDLPHSRLRHALGRRLPGREGHPGPCSAAPQ
jgi:hypothetical protein